MSKLNNKISFVIPCYNSEKTIKVVLDELRKTLNKNKQYEIILVDDCSKDNVLSILKEEAKKDKRIKVISLIRNFGQHAALLTGLRYTTGDFVICLDDDGQTPADEFPRLLEALDKDNSDVVYAKYLIKHHSFFRNVGSSINSLMMRIMLNKPKDLYISSYFVCKKYIVDELIKYNNPYPYLAGLILQTTKNISNVNVNHRSRKEGNSGYTLTKLINLWMNGFTAFSVKPLRIADVFGLICSCSGFIYGIILIIKRLIGKYAVLGYSSIMASILFIGGIIMIMLGLIGEYMGRMYISINNAPQAIIKERVNL